MIRFAFFAAAFLTAAEWTGLANAATPVALGKSAVKHPRSSRLIVYPKSVDLDSDRDFQSLVAVLRQPDGVTIDVTDQVSWSLEDETIARLENNSVFPQSDGQSAIIVKFKDAQQRIALTVSGASTRPELSFEKDVLPALTRSGCNTGSCHGASRGKDGFRLSLFGFDPAGDYYRITRQERSRRVNLAIPQESLLLTKATGAVPHTGGKRFDADSDYYATILQWLRSGATEDASSRRLTPSGNKKASTGPPNALRATSLSLFPPQIVLSGDGSRQRMVAVATYADGTTRDVTPLAYFSSSDDSIADVDYSGVITAGSRGEAFVMARFGTHTVGSQVLTLPEDLPFIATKTPADAGDIDRLINRKLNLLRIHPSGPCSDQAFLRRATIDIVGLLPTPREYHDFVNDTAPDKRAKLIDRLLKRDEFSDIWAMKFADLLMIKSNKKFSYKSAYLYANWLAEKFANDVPVDQMVHQLLTSSGGTFSAPATNFFEVERETLKTSENVAQIFLGIRTQCAQCHNHPFDRWTMDDYYGFASFFARVGRKNGEDYRERIVFDRYNGELKHPLTGASSPPTFLGGKTPDQDGRHRRRILADWLTSGDNPYFARSMANRVWAHFMGVGIVHPVDDIRISNPPSNPELFDWLGRRFVQHKFDIRSLVRDICNSEAYGRSSDTTASGLRDERNYASSLIRRIPAQNLLDCLSAVTGSPDKLKGLPPGSRAVQIADAATPHYFLDAFGRSQRTTACACQASTSPSLSQALHLLNGEAVHRKVKQGKLIKTWIKKEERSPDWIIDQIYLRALCRYPSKLEKQRLIAAVYSADDQKAILEDVFWAVLNSREFIFNH